MVGPSVLEVIDQRLHSQLVVLLWPEWLGLPVAVVAGAAGQSELGLLPVDVSTWALAAVAAAES